MCVGLLFSNCYLLFYTKQISDHCGVNYTFVVTGAALNFENCLYANCYLPSISFPRPASGQSVHLIVTAHYGNVSASAPSAEFVYTAP